MTYLKEFHDLAKNVWPTRGTNGFGVTVHTDVFNITKNFLIVVVANQITVKPPKRDHIGDRLVYPCGEVGPISEVFLQIRYNIIHRIIERKKIMLQ